MSTLLLVHCRYNTEAYFSGQYGGSVLQSGTSVCTGYANKFEAMARKYFRVLCERIFTIVFSFGPRRAKQDLMKNDLMTNGFGGNALKFNIKFECSKNVSLLQ